MDSSKNKEILKEANDAIERGDVEKFLSFCAEDIIWTYVGDQTLSGKEEIRQYMTKSYKEQPKFTVTNMISEGDYLAVLGEILIKDENDKEIAHSYSDIWRFRDSKMIELKAFVIKA